MDKKVFWTTAVCAALIMVIGMATLLQPKAVEASSWGLSFQKDGESPVGNDSAAYLLKYGAYYIGSGKNIYLTFDAGYENGNTAKILDTLKEKGVCAAFFLVGNYIEQNADLVKRMAAEGHIVGNHTYSHPDMSAITDFEKFKEQIVKLQELYTEKVGGQMSAYYRPPSGKYSEQNLKYAQQLGLKMIFWSLAYVDWYQDAQPSREAALSKLIPRLHDGMILLLHSTSKTNADILGELIDAYRTKGYVFQSLDHLAGQSQKTGASPNP